MKALDYKIGIVEYDLVEIIEEWIRVQNRAEAYDILEAILNWRDIKAHSLIVEFIIYHEKEMGNQVCSQLDFMKYELAKRGLMKPEGEFGKPFTDENI